MKELCLQLTIDLYSLKEVIQHFIFILVSGNTNPTDLIYFRRRLFTRYLSYFNSQSRAVWTSSRTRWNVICSGEKAFFFYSSSLSLSLSISIYRSIYLVSIPSTLFMSVYSSFVHFMPSSWLCKVHGVTTTGVKLRGWRETDKGWLVLV